MLASLGQLDQGNLRASPVWDGDAWVLARLTRLAMLKASMVNVFMWLDQLLGVVRSFGVSERKRRTITGPY